VIISAGDNGQQKDEQGDSAADGIFILCDIFHKQHNNVISI